MHQACIRGKRESGNCRIWERIAKKLKKCSQFVCRDFSRLGCVFEELAENNTRQPFVPQLVSSPLHGTEKTREACCGACQRDDLCLSSYVASQLFHWEIGREKTNCEPSGDRFLTEICP